MSELNSLEDLQALYTDLLALSESRLSDLARLGISLDAHIRDFRNLLDKRARSDESRKSLATGILNVSGEEFRINEEFQQGALQLADHLNLDELDAARIFLDVQSETDSSGRSPLTNCIIRFHQRRKVLLDSLRLTLQLSVDVDQEEHIRASLQALISQVVQSQNAPPRYIQRCLSSMGDIKSRLQDLAEKLNSASILGQSQQAELLQTIEFERGSLVKQHESLGIVLLYLVKENNSVLADFEWTIDHLRKADKYDNLLLHYFPVLTAYISRFGGMEGGTAMADARAFNDRIFGQADEKPWSLPYVHAALRAWWLAEYSGWYGESHDGSIPDNQVEDETRQRSKQFTETLKDGAFDFILALSADVKSVEWQDPARHGLRRWLQRKAPPILADTVPFSDFFQEALMEQLEVFIEAFITNMPDVLRRLRVDEDEQRQLSKEHEHDLDLEKFIVIISYAFQGRPKAALEGFWDAPDGALIGFMHWASRRASTPLVSAFCEMLQAISEDSECATAAHYFLLDDGPHSSAKMRRTHSLTWNQIFKELTFFSAKIRDRPVLSQAQTYRPGKPHSDLAEAEPESTLMLECYLRLITRLCSESATARTFLAHHSSFHITDLLFQLTSSAIEPRLRACAFTTIRSLLSEKTREAGEYLWTALDVWMSGGYSPGSIMPKTASSASVTTSAVSIAAILRSLASGFEEPNAFVQLLQALISPYADESGLHDSLPFPENLGISSRQPGIDPYIDFALGMVFGKGAAELNDIVQVRLLHLSCLDFIATCLDTFNEDLVIFANQSNIVVDSAIQASSLQTYVLLHPFSRVMEWMYNDKVMDALFAAINQDSADVANSAPNSPLVLCLLRGIHVMTAILDLQPTYLDIIRPLVKLQPNHRRSPVQNAAFSSFEEGVLTHLSIIPNLGHYCGSGHSELVIASLKLLEKLSASPRLASAPSAGLGRGPTRNKILAALDKDADAISKILLGEMESDIDINQGPESSAYITKLQILDFLISCLRANPGRPTIAHLLLGFRCNNDTISVDADGPFSRGTSLFHTILASVLTATLESEVGISSWLVALSYKGLQVLKELWASPMSSILTMTEMRVNESFFSLFVRELVIQPGTVFNDLELADPAFISSTSASCLSDFLCRRALILQYLSAELRQVARGHSPSLKQRIFETLLGSTADEDGVKFEHATIFDLFDFVEPEFNLTLHSPKFSWFSNIDMYACLDDYDPSSTYNIPKVEELLVLRKAELVHANRISVQEEPDVISEAQGIILFYAQENQIKILGASRLNLLRSWVQLTLLMNENGEFDGAGKTSFVLRTLQTIMPRLESDLEVIPEAMELARLAKSLIFSLDFGSDAFKQGDMGELVSDRLFHLFQVSLRAINTLGSNVSLKELFYNISYRYLSGMSDVSKISGIHRRHSIQTIKSAGERFIDLVCDDAHASDPTCRIAALLLLGALVKMGKHENSKYIIESLSRLNFIGILVHSIQNIAVDLRETTAEGMAFVPHIDITLNLADVNIQLSYCHAKLALLLHISQIRFGAAAVFNAGLFHSVRVSELFATDPDLGVDIAGPDAISKHYDLLAAIMRIICAAVLSRGPQHQQTLEQGRRFLTENRLSILSVLKKSAGLGTGIDMSQQQGIEELADSFMLLMSVTGFLEADEKTNIKNPVLTSFT